MITITLSVAEAKLLETVIVSSIYNDLNSSETNKVLDDIDAQLFREITRYANNKTN